jgi:hypothetical protein
MANSMSDFDTSNHTRDWISAYRKPLRPRFWTNPHGQLVSLAGTTSEDKEVIQTWHQGASF